VLVVLILLYVGTQIASTLMMSTPTMDKTQQRLMLLLPLFFVLFIIRFPAGLILYWITTNAWTMGQQYVIRRRVGPVTPLTTTGPSGPSVPAQARAAREGANGASSGGLAGLLRGRTKTEDGEAEVDKREAKQSASKQSASKQPASVGATSRQRSRRDGPPPPPPRKKKKRSGRRR
jgi:YidC/Oxa1 family membrane protein insertase